MPKAHRVVCATSARSCAITSGAALPVSCMRRQHSSLQRASAPTVKPLRPSHSKTVASWPTNSSMACAHSGLPWAAALVLLAASFAIFLLSKKGC